MPTICLADMRGAVFQRARPCRCVGRTPNTYRWFAALTTAHALIASNPPLSGTSSIPCETLMNFGVSGILSVECFTEESCAWLFWQRPQLSGQPTVGQAPIGQIVLTITPLIYGLQTFPPRIVLLGRLLNSRSFGRKRSAGRAETSRWW